MSREAQIRSILQEHLKPVHLELEDLSEERGGEAGAGTHWKAVIVSEAFDGTRQLQRHQDVRAMLGDEVMGTIKSLGMLTLTPDECRSHAAERIRALVSAD